MQKELMVLQNFVSKKYIYKKSKYWYVNMSWDISVIAQLWSGWPGFDYWQGREVFLFSTVYRPALGTTCLPMH
jgi:hypothetical protein